MADNCPFWSKGKCAPPSEPTNHDCNYQKPTYENCAVYKMFKVRAAGGSMEDQLQAMGAINPGGRVVGGRGRIFSDDEIGQAIGSRETKKWWQFWK